MVTLKGPKTPPDMKRILTFFVSFIFSASLFSQGLIRTDSIQVYQNSILLKNAWAGGINNAQVSEIDLNGDSFMDLFIFDKSGDKVMTFINEGISGIASYKHAPQYEPMFPKLRDWALLRDFNCDGKQDIFTYNNGSVTVFKNTTTSAGNLTFIQYQKPIISDYGQYNLALYVSSIDIPSISDIDGDGDLDILTFSVAGMQVEFHKNMTKENFSNCDSLNYVLSDKCWGSFLESPSNCTANINQTCQHLREVSPDSIRQRKNNDSGFSLLTFDNDNDGDMELVVSTANCTGMYLLTNTGTTSNAFIGSITNNYPPSSPVNIARFPAGYYLDLDNDAKKDLVVSPNVVNISENYKSVLFYKNTGTAASPDFSFAKGDFLQSEMLEFGESSNPVLFDYDGDGLTDLFVSSYGYFQNNNFKSQIAHYRNIGSASEPVFQLITRDFENLSSRSLSNIHHSFGDVDNDGDIDFVIGDNAGRIQYFENTGGGYTLIPDLRDSAGTIIDVGSTAAPQLFDLNKDGRLDLIIGEQNGNLNYFRNNGTSFKNMRDSLGKVNVTQKGFFTGSSKPWFFIENNVTKLYVGSERGYIFAYDNIDNNLTGIFRLIDSIYQDINPGIKSTVAAADLNNDGMCEVIIGNKRGGLEYYRAAGLLNTYENTRSKTKVYPNPSEGTFSISGIEGIRQIRIYDMKGVLAKEIMNIQQPVQTEGLTPGVYILQCITEQESFTTKLVIE